MKKDEHFWSNLSLKSISACQEFCPEIVKYTIWCTVSRWWCTKPNQGSKQMGWTPLWVIVNSWCMSISWQCVCEKAVFNRMECDAVECPMDLQSQFPISGRRTLLLSGKNSRKSCIICCLVNMPWITVSLLLCFHWPYLLLF